MYFPFFTGQEWSHVVMFTIDVGASMGIKGCRSTRRTWLS